MTDQPEYPMSTVKNLRDCRHYATLLCAARICAKRWRSDSVGTEVCERIARALYFDADPSIHSALDTIKRVLEIDTDVDNVGAVLMHAGIAMKAKETETKEGSEP